MTDTVQQETAHQMRIFLKGAAQLIGEEDLMAKLARSIQSGIPLTIKFGMDPSAPDIHLGHAVVLRKLKQIQDLGHHIVIIIGDFTGKIGDPTGKSKGRRALCEQEILFNAQTYQEQVFHILDKDKTEIRCNGEWLELLKLDEIIKLASTITVARMLERDDFENRFTHNIPIGLHEFFYPLMQAYDSVAIKADLELGGTDQTFNILMGRSLQKDFGQEPQAALFMPVLEGLDGVEKMSKSLGNHIGILEDAKVMFKKVMEVPDSLILRYFELATDVMPDEPDQTADATRRQPTLRSIKAALDSGENPRNYKLLLARTITALYHQPEDAALAEEFFYQAFTRKEPPTDIPVLSISSAKATLTDLIPLLIREGFVSGSNEFRRLLSQGGIRINTEKITDLTTPVRDGDVLKIGKKKFVRLCLSSAITNTF